MKESEEDSPAHRDELRTGQVIEGKIILEELGDVDDFIGSRGFSSGSDLFIVIDVSSYSL